MSSMRNKPVKSSELGLQLSQLLACEYCGSQSEPTRRVHTKQGQRRAERFPRSQLRNVTKLSVAEARPFSFSSIVSPEVGFCVTCSGPQAVPRHITYFLSRLRGARKLSLIQLSDQMRCTVSKCIPSESLSLNAASKSGADLGN